MGTFSDTSVNLFFKWDTASGGNRSFRIGTPLAPYRFSGSDEMVRIGSYLLINIPAGEAIESGSGTVSSDSGTGYVRIIAGGVVRYYSVNFGNYATSAPRVNVIVRIDPVDVPRFIYGP